MSSAGVSWATAAVFQCFGMETSPLSAVIEQGEEAGFSAAVFADQADAAAGGEGEGGLVEQHFQAALQGEVFDFYHV